MIEIRPLKDCLGFRSGRAHFLKQCIPTGGIGAEIGVYKGQFSRVLLDVAKPSKLHLIDLWYLLALKWHWGRGNHSTIDALCSVLRSYRAELATGKVVLHVADDLELLPTFDDGYFDWVYIDTTHAYKQTKAELEILKAKVKESGVIAGDDWQESPEHRHHGVCRAVREFVVQEPYKLAYSSMIDHQWAIRRQ